MQKTGRIIFLLFIFISSVLFFPVSGQSSEIQNLLYNGDFEILDSDGLPDGWFTDAYRMDPGYTVYSVTDGFEGEYAASIHNAAKNDARFAQTVAVEPEKLYCFSGYLLADDVSEGHGANLSIEGIYAFSEKVYDTEGTWQKIEYYGETGPGQTEVTVFARIGGYSGESKGSASFDNLLLTEVEKLPPGVLADFWYQPDEYGNEDIWDDPEETGDEEKTAGPAWPVLIALALLYCLILAAFVYYFRDGETIQSDRFQERNIRIAPLMLLALILRLTLAFFIKGYGVDVNCFVSWGAAMAQNGPAGFYQATGFCDYPPLYMYAVGLNAWISGFAAGKSGLIRMIFRFIPSICDVIGCWMILKYAEQKKSNNIYIRIILILLAFNPATILNSAAWGQMDSVLCLLLLAVALFAVEGRWICAIGFYVTSILVKPQALILGFLGLAFMILAVIQDRTQLKKILTGIAVGIGLMVVYILPFGIRQQPGWLIARYTETLSSYEYATLNTANLYYLGGGNWKSLEAPAQIGTALFLALACAAHGMFWMFQNKDKKAYLTETILAEVFAAWFLSCAIAGLSWKFIGIAAMAYAFVVVISMTVRHADIRFLPYLGALLFILLYVFGLKMHERYLFPAFLLLALAWVQYRDRRILYLLLLFSTTVFINEGIVLDNSIRLGDSLGHLNPDTVLLADVLSILNVLGAIAAVAIGYGLMKGHQIPPVKKIPGILPVRTCQTGRSAGCYRPDRKLHWKTRDTLILLTITVLYSVAALTTLGSIKAPQTCWSSSGEEEEIVFDLQKEYSDIRVLYFGQVSRSDFKVAQSSDGIAWYDERYAQMDQGQCWKWKYVTESYDHGNGERTFYNSTEYIVHFSGRYIRLSAGQIGLKLNEVIFRDSAGNTIPCQILHHTGAVPESVLYSDPQNLIDEQDSMENLPAFPGYHQDGDVQPSWWNSTYFDEIYHARTGFEFTERSVPYETSHPPLGKIFISWGIMTFGMTPFGWRFAGALAGILMLPGIYLLAKQLTKKTWTAGLACGLMALDCMHMTQSQIATIDSFPVLFIIFAFFFMLRFIQTDLRKCSLSAALVPLACSGLFMGLSIASKWIGIYAGIGLAILYFWHCFRQIRMEQPENDPAGINTLRKVFILSLCCILFFVIVPVIIYLLSYIPYMAYNTRILSFRDYLNAVWRAQESMLSYHSTPGLGMDHPFYSPWWEWPVIGKPMFYASELYIPDDAVLHHSIFCFGNPCVWWGALVALPFTLFLWLREKHYLTGTDENRWHLNSLSWDNRYEFVFIGLLAQYLPWVLVPRGTYIYHYFASIPFLILMISIALTNEKPEQQKIMKIIGWALLAVSFALFIVLLPYASGIAAPRWWLEMGKSILHIWY